MLVVTSKFAPHAGGTSVVWTHWCRCWPPEQLRVIAPRVAGDAAYDAQQACRILRCAYPDIPKIRMPWLWANQALTLLGECRKERPDLVHFGHVFENGFMGPLVKRMLGVPYFVHTYAEELMLAKRIPFLRSLVSLILKEADGVTTISRFTEGLHASFGYRKPALLVHPAVDTQRYQPGPGRGVLQRFGIPPGLTLLTVGRLMERKGHDRVIAMMPRLLERFTTLQYAIAGVGPYQAVLREKVDALGLQGRVHFLGRVDDDDLPALFQESTVFVHPSIVTSEGDVEGFGIVFLEAAACAIPIVGGNTGGIPDSVHDGVNGYLIGTDDELFERLDGLLSAPDLRRQMGEEGRKWACTFDWGKAARKVWDYSLERLPVSRNGNW